MSAMDDPDCFYCGKKVNPRRASTVIVDGVIWLVCAICDAERHHRGLERIRAGEAEAAAADTRPS